MKTCFLVLACVAYAAAAAVVTIEHTPEEMAQYKKFKTECVEETKVDEALVENFDKGTFPADYKESKCFSKCVFGKYGHWDENEHFVHDTKVANGAKEEIMKECMKETGEDLCEKSFNVHKCYIAHIKH